MFGSNLLKALASVLAAFVLFTAPGEAHAQVRGYVDGTFRDSSGGYFIRGWACQVGYDQSINVHAYVGGPAGVGTYLMAGTANQASEAGVATQCQAGGTAYRFHLSLTAAARAQHDGKLIYVHGISLIGSGNLAINKSGLYRIPGPAAAIRRYVYNSHQELCKSYEPESGTTVMGYDGAGNLAWSAGGLNLTSHNSCNEPNALASGRVVTRDYDARNRLKSVVFPDHKGDTFYSYDPDGQLASILADNSGADLVTTEYTYNRRRLMTGERLMWGTIDWPVTYTYNANGHLSAQKWHGLNIIYAPNALGQPTQAGTYASTVTYYPNGAIKSFTYGNNINHTLAQNVRGLPDRSRDVYGSTVFLDDGYDYDQNGNVAAISDGTSGSAGDRTMTYDALDRLTKTVAPGMFGTATYTYDALDNLTRAKLTGGQVRDHYYCYDAKWRLTNVKTGGCSGATVMGLGYNVQGNVANRNGRAYTFDYGNRLRSVSGPAASYLYDGHGRRVWDSTGEGAGDGKVSQYTQRGELVMESNRRKGTVTEYIYLQGSLVALRERNTATNVYTVKYQHTDALGSPVAITGQSRAVLEKRKYEPYGLQLTPTPQDGPGYTGHVYDAATGMVYMQQRYYDPAIGRFLSVDPVAANASTGDNFNRYWYANNNPYKFTDPDGRETGAAFRVVNNATNGKPVEPPPKSPQDKLGPAIGVALGAVIAAPVVAELGMVALANPSAVATATTVAGEAAGVTGLAGGAGAAARALSAEGKALANAQPVGSALKSDAMHRAASFVRQEAAEVGTHTPLVGGDGVTRTLTQMPGGLNGQAGRFEYIVEQGGNMTHQRFVPNGTINGVPNKP